MGWSIIGRGNKYRSVWRVAGEEDVASREVDDA